MLLITQVSKKSKVPVHLIKMYEKLGLIRGKKRSGTRKETYTYYDLETIERLEIIEACRTIGMGITDISMFVKGWYGQRISNSRRLELLEKQITILQSKADQINEIQDKVLHLKSEISKFV